MPAKPDVILWEEESPGWRRFVHGACAGFDEAVTAPVPENMKCPGCKKTLPVHKKLKVPMHSAYARSGPNARTLAQGWHLLALEGHPEWKGWDQCSEEYRSALERKFARLIAEGLIQ